jgi:LMBR1 domain-containing protein 1
MDVSALMYIVAIVSLFGWVMFAMFGGVGLPALPFDLLLDFKHRPRRVKLQEYTEKKKLIGEQAALLLHASAALSDEKKKLVSSSSTKKARKYRTQENEFKRVRREMILDVFKAYLND